MQNKIVQFLAWDNFLSYIKQGSCVCCILAFDPAQNAIQGDALEGSDTFQWQLGEEIA